MHVDLRIHPTFIVGAGASWVAAVGGIVYGWPYAFEGGLAASVAFVGVGLAVKPRVGIPTPKLAPLKAMQPGGALKSPTAPELAGTASPRGGPQAPPRIAAAEGEPVALEVIDDDEVEVMPAVPPKPVGTVPWARAEAAGPLMFEGHAPLASEANRRIWAARDPPAPAKVQPTGVIHGVCGRCGTRISVTNARPVWATCPVCGHSKLLN